MVKRRRAETQARRTRHRVGVKGLSIELEENGLNRDVVRQAEGVYVVVVAVVVGAVWSSLWSMETSLSTSSHGGQSMTSLFIFAPLIRVVMPIYGNCLVSSLRIPAVKAVCTPRRYVWYLLPCADGMQSLLRLCIRLL